MDVIPNGSTKKCSTIFRNVYSESEFVLVVVTVDGVQVKLYKNGVAQTPVIAPYSNDQCTYRVSGNSNPLKLGTYYFGGTIKSFAVWDRILSPNEIANLENGRLTCP